MTNYRLLLLNIGVPKKTENYKANLFPKIQYCQNLLLLVH